jgi:hypothetical protein
MPTSQRHIERQDSALKPSAVAPRPRTPLGHSVPHPVGLPTDPGRSFLDLADLIEVAVWTARGGGWQEHASFLLGTTDGHWYVIGFGEAAASRLVAQLCERPEFDTDLLLDVIGQRDQRVVRIWRNPAHAGYRPSKELASQSLPAMIASQLRTAAR